MENKRLLKKIIALILFSTVQIISSINLFSQQRQIVKVAVMDYPNYLTIDNSGNVSGYVYEYLKEIQKYTNWEYEFVRMSFEESTKKLVSGEVDLVPGNQYTEEREKLWNYSRRNMGEGGTVICTLNDNNKYAYNDFRNFSGMKIACLRGSIRNKQTKDYLSKYNVKVNFIYCETDEESKLLLESGKVDALVMSTIRCEEKYKIIAKINTNYLYFCMNKNKPNLKKTN